MLETVDQETDLRLQHAVWHAIQKHDDAVDESSLRRCVPALAELIRCSDQAPPDGESVGRILRDNFPSSPWMLSPDHFERLVAHIVERLNRFRQHTRYESEPDPAGPANWIG